MNRWQLESMRSGLAQELKAATEKLSTLYADANSTLEARTTQKAAVEDIKERLEGINAQVKAADEEAAEKLKTGAKPTDPKEARVKAKAAIYRAAMRNEPAPAEHFKALADTSETGGDKFLPKTVATEIISEPMVKNPLRDLSTMTNITNLEVPKIAFSLSDDSFIEDSATAKEIKAAGSTVQFGRHKFKVFVDVSETVLIGTDTNLVGVVDRGLESGLAKKEKKVAFADKPNADEKHMSFYAKKEDGSYEIAMVEGPNIYKAILAASGDLEEDYRENASVVMRYADYLKIIEYLANGSTTLYGVQPSQVIGKPVTFCDLATIPVVGDFSYSHYNYDLDMQYERDKNVKTGMESFVLTAWFDHQIKMKSAFRLAKVKESQ